MLSCRHNYSKPQCGQAYCSSTSTSSLVSQTHFRKQFTRPFPLLRKWVWLARLVHKLVPSFAVGLLNTPSSVRPILVLFWYQSTPSSQCPTSVIGRSRSTSVLWVLRICMHQSFCVHHSSPPICDMCLISKLHNSGSNIHLYLECEVVFWTWNLLTYSIIREVKISCLCIPLLTP